MKIYTKTGDKGTTSSFAGKRVDKDSLRIAAYGNVDELNSLIGVIIATLGIAEKKDFARIIQKLNRVQNELFVLQSDLAALTDIKIKIPRITSSYVIRLEKEIDSWENTLPKLRNFILPGGGEIGAKLHLARTVARRAERSMVSLSKQEKISKYALSYINRLSDWLFVFARYVNQVEKIFEVKWMGRSK